MHAKKKKKLSLEQGKKLLEDTKTRLRLEQEARTRERIEQIEFERFDRLRIKLCGEYWTLEVQQTHSQSFLVKKTRITILKTLPLTQR